MEKYKAAARMALSVMDKLLERLPEEASQWRHDCAMQMDALCLLAIYDSEVRESDLEEIQSWRRAVEDGHDVHII